MVIMSTKIKQEATPAARAEEDKVTIILVPDLLNVTHFY